MADNGNMSDVESDFDNTCSSHDGSSSDEDQTEVRPYMYEPLVDETNTGIAELSVESVTENSGNTHELSVWCQCGNCGIMDTEEECVCCQNIPNIKKEMDDYAVNTCIVDHPGFEPACLNPIVLRIAYYQYRQQYGDDEGPDGNERKRYTAYRQLVRWCWGYLGREVRVVLPSCAVLAIRKTFPSDSYEGFHRV